MKICITGGSGFIGTRLSKRLSKQNVDFKILDLKKSQTFPDSTILGDITKIEHLPETLTADVIIHLAAAHRDDIRNPNIYHETNVEGTQQICALADRSNIHHIIFTSTVAVYGFAPANTDETGEINPFNDYGRTKWEAEQVLYNWQKEDPEKRSVTIIRPTVVFGEGNRGNVYNLLKQIQSGLFVMIGSGHNKKSMAYVENVAAFLEAAARTAAPGNVRVFNYIDKPDYTMNELVKTVRGLLKGKDSIGLRLPLFLGLGLGKTADFIAKLTGRTLPLSTIRVQKFTQTTQFSTQNWSENYFIPPISIKDGVERTLNYEFIEPPNDKEVFYTE